jgi:hypothetical protein
MRQHSDATHQRLDETSCSPALAHSRSQPARRLTAQHLSQWLPLLLARTLQPELLSPQQGMQCLWMPSWFQQSCPHNKSNGKVEADGQINRRTRLSLQAAAVSRARSFRTLLLGGTVCLSLQPQICRRWNQNQFALRPVARSSRLHAVDQNQNCLSSECGSVPSRIEALCSVTYSVDQPPVLLSHKNYPPNYPPARAHFRFTTRS